MKIARFLLSHIQDGSNILDFGCGNLNLARELVRNNPGLTITGIDVIEDQNLERDSLPDNLRFVQYKGRELPFPADSFSLVIASSAMHHTHDPEYYFSEFNRILKEHGEVLLVEEMYLNPFDRLVISAQDWLLNKMKKGVPVPLNFRSYKHYVQLFDQKGFNIKYEGSIRPGFPFVHHYVFRLQKK
ncbi:MAG: class I SAM-dependent methyltransferase [Bacteroidota bacterium]|nr:class I SAM-dependent methyltransferase [Bacteroidota bacterium]